MSPATVALLAGSGAALLITIAAWIKHSWTIAFLSGVIAILLVRALIGWTTLIGVLAVLIIVVVLVVWLRRTGTASTVTRWGARSRRKAGVASTVDIARVASWAVMRRKACVVRPSLVELTRRERLRLPTHEVGVPLCRAGLLRVWASVEDVVCLFGGPRTGKTGWLAGRVLDAPGAVLVTSTRTDLHSLTAGLRTRRGPVYVFNAVGLGDLPSTITFDPLTGCTDPVTATERATDLLAAGETGISGDRAFWDAQARRVLAALLHAAALGDLSMRSVLEWVVDPDQAHREVTSLLRRSPEPAYVEDAAQFLTTNERTRTSITSTIMPALGW
ncbi:MAG: type IV secretory system conjugative DNA transfer family protein, partial [Pseudonocardiaceae bacterium]